MRGVAGWGGEWGGEWGRGMGGGAAGDTPGTRLGCGQGQRASEMYWHHPWQF